MAGGEAASKSSSSFRLESRLGVVESALEAAAEFEAKVDEAVFDFLLALFFSFARL